MSHPAPGGLEPQHAAQPSDRQHLVLLSQENAMLRTKIIQYETMIMTDMSTTTGAKRRLSAEAEADLSGNSALNTNAAKRSKAHGEVSEASSSNKSGLQRTAVHRSGASTTSDPEVAAALTALAADSDTDEDGEGSLGTGHAARPADIDGNSTAGGVGEPKGGAAGLLSAPAGERHGHQLRAPGHSGRQGSSASQGLLSDGTSSYSDPQGSGDGDKSEGGSRASGPSGPSAGQDQASDDKGSDQGASTESGNLGEQDGSRSVGTSDSGDAGRHGHGHVLGSGGSGLDSSPGGDSGSSPGPDSTQGASSSLDMGSSMPMAMLPMFQGPHAMAMGMGMGMSIGAGQMYGPQAGQGHTGAMPGDMAFMQQRAMAMAVSGQPAWSIAAQLAVAGLGGHQQQAHAAMLMQQAGQAGAGASSKHGSGYGHRASGPGAKGSSSSSSSDRDEAMDGAGHGAKAGAGYRDTSEGAGASQSVDADGDGDGDFDQDDLPPGVEFYVPASDDYMTMSDPVKAKKAKKGKMDDKEKAKVTEFIARLTSGSLIVARGDLARALQDFINPQRPREFYEKLVSRRNMNQDFSHLLAPRRPRKRRPASSVAWSGSGGSGRSADGRGDDQTQGDDDRSERASERAPGSSVSGPGAGSASHAGEGARAQEAQARAFAAGMLYAQNLARGEGGQGNRTGSSA